MSNGSVPDSSPEDKEARPSVIPTVAKKVTINISQSKFDFDLDSIPKLRVRVMSFNEIVFVDSD
jgi:hypothetical protein